MRVRFTISLNTCANSRHSEDFDTQEDLGLGDSPTQDELWDAHTDWQSNIIDGGVEILEDEE